MAMKHATEYVRGLQYKLRSMGILVDECAYIYGDNKSVLVNLGTPHSLLKKISNSIAYHYVCEVLPLMNGGLHISTRMEILLIW